MPGTDVAHAGTGERACILLRGSYAMSGTDIAYAATSRVGCQSQQRHPLTRPATPLRACYAMS
eukprot:2155517-Rhodomonas_salina.1